MGCFGVNEEQGEGSWSPRRHHVGSANVAGSDFSERGRRRFPRLSGDLDGEAHERDAITQALSLLDLKVDEKSKQQLVDDPRSGFAGWPQATPFAHDEVARTRNGIHT